MLIITLQNKNDQINYNATIYNLFYDYACDHNIQKHPNADDLFYGIPVRLFLNYVEEWAMEKYLMKLKFVPKSSTSPAIGKIFIGWEGFNNDDIEYMFLNMYPQQEN